MKSTLAILALCVMCTPANAATVTLDFDNLRSDISGLDLGGVAITSGTNDVSVGFSGVGSFALFSLDSIYGTATGDKLFRADFFVPGVSSVSIEMGDGRLYDPVEDLDDLILRAYDRNDRLIAATLASIESTFDIFLALRVTAPNISYVRFGGIDTNGFNTVFADNLSFTYGSDIAPVPLPATAFLLTTALGLLALARRRCVHKHRKFAG